MSATYVIQKQVGGEWVEAWGLKPRSYPAATTDADAIAIFRRETQRVRTPYRLVRMSGWGYSVSQTVVEEKP